MQLLKGPARIAIMSLVLVAVLFLFIFPTRSFLSQRSQVSQARHDLAALRAQNARLAREAARLQTPAEIEKIAREQYFMTFPGERAFAVIPAAPTTTTTAP